MKVMKLCLTKNLNQLFINTQFGEKSEGVIIMWCPLCSSNDVDLLPVDTDTEEYICNDCSYTWSIDDEA